MAFHAFIHQFEGAGGEEGAQLGAHVDQDTSSARVGQDVQRAHEEERRSVGHCQDGLTRLSE